MHSNYANLLSELKRSEEAEQQYKKAIEADPNIPKAYSNYGLMLYELERVKEAEEKFKKAIEVDPQYAIAHSNYGLMLYELERVEEAEEHYNKAIEINPKYSEAHSNFANLLNERGNVKEAEEHYKKAIDANPNLSVVHSNYGLMLDELEKVEEAEEHYKKAIELDPQFAEVHSNYGLMLDELGKVKEAEEHYKKTLELDPNIPEVYLNYGLLLHKLKKVREAEEHYKKALELDPKLAEAHGAYSLLLIEKDKRKEALEKINKASSLFAQNEDLTMSHLAKAWFYEHYAEKNFKRKKFSESGEDAGIAGDEFLKGAETTNADLKGTFSQQGNILKAKSFIRKVPKKSWHRKILYRLGKKGDITDIINNLKEAASYYEKASLCLVDEKQDVCNACHISISVFSDTLSAMDAFINKRSAEINKNKWNKSLESARRIYEEKGYDNGVALVDTLKQLILCVDELAVHRESGLKVQTEKCGKCFGKLAEVSENLDGALNVLAEHSIEAIRDYAKKQGMGGFVTDTPKKSIFNNWLVRVIIFVVATIFLNLVSSKLYDLNILAIIWNYLKSLIS